MSNVAKIKISGAKIVNRNFRGEERRFNKAGDRNFILVIPEDMVEDLLAEGWNVKQFKPSDDGTPGDHFIRVKVGFDKRPPMIWLVTEKAGKKVRTMMTANTIGELDYANIIDCKLTVRPYIYDGGVTGYVETMYVEIENIDPFAELYDFEE